MNGKHFSWQAICKLPFIEESRLLSEISKVEHTLTDEERRRNSLGLDVLFIHISHPLAVEINSCCKEMNDNKKFLEVKVIQEIDPKLSGGMNGYIYISDRAVWAAEIYSSIEGMQMIAKNEILSVFFMNPSFNTHFPRLMSGVILPAKSVCEQDVLPLDVLWRTKSACKKLSSRRKVSQRPIPESVSGPSLTKQECLTETLQCTKIDDHVDANGLEEPRMEVKSRKRKRIRDKQIEGVVPICSVQNMESYSVGGKREVDAFSIGADELVKFKIGEEKSTNRKQIESDGATCNISGNLQSCGAELPTEGISDHLVVNRLKEVKTVYKSEKWKENEVEGVSNNNFEKLKGVVLRQQSKGDDDYAVLDSLGEQKTEVKSKKKKQRYKKRKVTEGNGIPFISVEKLDGPRELRRGYAVGLQGIGEVNANVKLESSSSGDQNKGCVGLLGINAEVKSKKRKRKSKKRKGRGGGDVPHKSAEKLECISSRELNKRDGNLAVAVGLQVARKVNTGGKLESSSHGEQNKGDGDQASAVGLQGVRTGENAGGLLGIIPEVKCRKRKNRSKKRKLSESDHVPPMSVEKLDSSISRELNKGDGGRVIACGLQAARTVVTTSDGKLRSSSIGEQNQVDVDRVSAVGSLGVKTEANVDGLLRPAGKSRKIKCSSKKRKPSDGHSVPPKSVEILDNSSLGEQNKEDGS